jgi:hypothetical protein
MELQKQSFRYFQSVLDAVSAPEVSADMIVPDLFPDMERIVDSTGLACVKETVCREERLDLTGTVRVNVLYKPDGEDGLRNLDVSIPFNHVFDGRFPTGSEAHPDVRLIGVETRAVNPRKISVLARLSVHALVYAPEELSVPFEADGTCEVKRHSCAAYLPTAVASRRFTLNEPIEIPASRPAADTLVSILPGVEVLDVKAVGSKAVVKGAAILNILYLSGGEPYHTEHELAISQIIDMDGLEEHSDVDIDLRVTGIEMDYPSDTEMRNMTAFLHLEAHAVARTERRFEAITDLYSTTSRLVPSMEPLLLTELSERGVNKQPVRETIECEDEVRSVICTRVMPGPVMRLESGEMGCEVFASLLYLTEEGEFRSHSQKITVSSGAETEGASVFSKQAGEITAAPTSGGIELRFNLNFAFIATNTEKLLVAGSVHEEEMESSLRPSVVLRRCHSGEGFWEIAKHYNTTVSELCLANGLSDCDETPCGQLLLIPKKR